MKAMIDATTIILLVLSWWLALSAYPRLPSTIPSHFNFKGVADGWAGRWTIFLLPSVATFLYGLNTWLFSRAAVRQQVPDAVSLPLHLLKLELAGVFAYLTWQICEVAFGRAERLSRWFLPVTVLVLGLTSAWLALAKKGLQLG